MDSIYNTKKKISYELKVKFGWDNKIAGIQDKCIFCFSGANQIKKSIGTMIDAFSIADNGKMALVLALKNIDSQIGTYRFQGEYDMNDLISNPNIHVINSALDDKAHASIFRMSDFLLYPSQGEAPGLQMSEAQLCGCIPIATNYTGLPEESCFPELLINEFALHRGQFNCYRAIVDARLLTQHMERAFDFWTLLNDSTQVDNSRAIERFQQFMKDVEHKLKNRTWRQTALEFDAIFKSFASKTIRIDQEMIKL